MLKQIDKALRELHRPPGGPEIAAHDARVCFKKIRAVLRLSRGALAPRWYKEQDKRFRDLGREIADLRDRDVRVETFDKLMEHFHNQLEPKAFADVRAALLRAKRPRDEKKRALARLERDVRAARRGIEKSFSLKRQNFPAIRPGLKQLYSDGRQMMATATHTRTVADLHEWRKHVKALAYAETVLTPVWQGMVEKLKDEFDHLGDCLSEDHDLAILRETVKDLADHPPDVTEVEALLALIDRRRTELETEAELLGSRLYAEKPSAFVGRMESYWKAWRTERGMGLIALANSAEPARNGNTVAQ